MQNNAASNLFLEKSYQTIAEDYAHSLNSPEAAAWNMVFITASGEKQAESYRMQIKERLKNNHLHQQTEYIVLPDPDGKRIGSGGATLSILKYLSEKASNVSKVFKQKILVIHSGGDSRRIPQYSVCGKLFSPVPRMLPDGRRSVLFDEIMLSLSALPGRMNHGILTISGDVLMLFNPFQIDLKLKKTATAISVKSPTNVGANHGVFLSDEKSRVLNFLHKQSAQTLSESGAVDDYDRIDIDTGAVWFNKEIITALYSLISTNNAIDLEKYNSMVNDNVRLSFYGDFLQPLAHNASYEEYLQSARDVTQSDDLLKCRRRIWSALNKFNMSLIKMSPAKFIHFGTTKELHELVCNASSQHEYLGWTKNVLTNINTQEFSINNSYIEPGAKIGANCYIEDCYIGGGVRIGNSSIVSNLSLENVDVPDFVVMHGIELDGNRYCVRLYHLDDNPKESIKSSFLSGLPLEGDDEILWTAKIYPVCNSMEEAVDAAISIYKIATGAAKGAEVRNWKNAKKTSLEESFIKADLSKTLSWRYYLESTIRAERFSNALDKKLDIADAAKILGDDIDKQIGLLIENAKSYDFSLRFRVYLAISYVLKKNNSLYNNLSYLHFENLCYETLKEQIADAYDHNYLDISTLSFKKDELTVELPARVNWGGPWSDTLPHSAENGGAVINTAIKLNGKFPIQVTIKKTAKKTISFQSVDLEEAAEFTSKNELLDLSDHDDPFLIHKCAFIVSGILRDDGEPLEKLLGRLNGGIEITSHIDIPKGSGLGTSSIFAAACIKALFDIFGLGYDNQSLYSGVLLLEQLIGTGGGWQDQAGALTNGLKLVKSQPATVQKLVLEPVVMPSDAFVELKERFALVYSGQQRFARNILREIMNKYILSDTQTLHILYEIQQIAVMMKFELERGNIQGFSDLLNLHYELSKKLDKGTSNSSIDLIFELCEDLIDGRFICGAGGGGFLQMILKKGVTKDKLQTRLNELFHGSGIEVWDCEIV